MPGAHVDLSGLRCNNPACTDRRRLVPDGEPGWTRCEACGHRAGGGELFRPYAALTGSWIVGTAVMLSVAWSRPSGAARWTLLAVGLAELGIFAWRLVYQLRTLRGLRANATDGHGEARS